MFWSIIQPSVTEFLVCWMLRDNDLTGTAFDGLEIDTLGE